MMRSQRVLGPVLLIALVAAAGLSAASVMYEYALGTHAHGVLQPLTIAIDAAGALLASLLALQLMTGLGYVAVLKRQVATHSVIAWPVLAVVALHGVGGTLHALQPPREAAPLGLVAMGVAVAVLVAWQVYEGRFEHAEDGPHRAAKANRHALLGMLVAALVLAHVVIGTVHAITG